MTHHSACRARPLRRAGWCVVVLSVLGVGVAACGGDADGDDSAPAVPTTITLGSGDAVATTVTTAPGGEEPSPGPTGSGGDAVVIELPATVEPVPVDRAVVEASMAEARRLLPNTPAEVLADVEAGVRAVGIACAYVTAAEAVTADVGATVTVAAEHIAAALDRSAFLLVTVERALFVKACGPSPAQALLRSAVVAPMNEAIAAAGG